MVHFKNTRGSSAPLLPLAASPGIHTYPHYRDALSMADYPKTKVCDVDSQYKIAYEGEKKIKKMWSKCCMNECFRKTGHRACHKRRTF